MRVLAATHRSQGDRAHDLSLSIEGELVWVPEACDYDGEDRRTCQCGCAWYFIGIASMCATTTAVVTELDITRAQYVDLVRGALERGGWPGEWAEGDVAELLYAAEKFHLGDIIERCGMVVRRRFDPVTGELLDWSRVDR